MTSVSTENIIHIIILTGCILCLILFMCPWLLSLESLYTDIHEPFIKLPGMKKINKKIEAAKQSRSTSSSTSSSRTDDTDVQVEELDEIDTPPPVKDDVNLTNSLDDSKADAEYAKKEKEMQQQVDREANLTDASKSSQADIEKDTNTKVPDPDSEQPQTGDTPKKVSDVADIDTSEQVGI